MNKIIVAVVVVVAVGGLWMVGRTFEEPPALTVPCAVVLDGSASGAKTDRLMKDHLATFPRRQGLRHCWPTRPSPVSRKRPSASSRRSTWTPQSGPMPISTSFVSTPSGGP